jgi:hypothetical protein
MYWCDRRIWSRLAAFGSDLVASFQHSGAPRPRPRQRVCGHPLDPAARALPLDPTGAQLAPGPPHQSASLPGLALLAPMRLASLRISPTPLRSVELTSWLSSGGELGLVGLRSPIFWKNRTSGPKGSILLTQHFVTGLGWPIVLRLGGYSVVRLGFLGFGGGRRCGFRGL